MAFVQAVFAQGFRKVGSGTDPRDWSGRGLEEIRFQEQIRFRLQWHRVYLSYT